MIVLTTAGILRERMKQVLGLMVVVAQILGTVTGKAKWYLIETEDETGPGYGTGVPDKGEHPVLPPSILPDNYNLETDGGKLHGCTDVNGTIHAEGSCWRINCFNTYCCYDGYLDARSSHNWICPPGQKTAGCGECVPDGGEGPNILPSD